MHDHHHQPAHHDHHSKDGSPEQLFQYRSVEKRKLILSLVVTLVVMVVELAGGLWTGSIALVSDAGHMFTHAFAIIIGLVAIIIAQKPPCHHRTFGLYRTEILGAFVNGLFLILVVAIIVYESVMRVLEPVEVLATPMLVVALLGLAANLVTIYILHGSHQHDLNVKGVFYHMLGDAVSSVGVVAGGVVIYYTGWDVVDPLISLGISAIIAIWAWSILKESSRILLEMTPAGLDIDTISKDLETRFPEVGELYHIHLWAITPEMLAFSAHIKLKDGHQELDQQCRLIKRMEVYLGEKYKVVETTIQVDDEHGELSCKFARNHDEE